MKFPCFTVKYKRKLLAKHENKCINIFKKICNTFWPVKCKDFRCSSDLILLFLYIIIGLDSIVRCLSDRVSVVKCPENMTSSSLLKRSEFYSVIVFFSIFIM